MCGGKSCLMNFKKTNVRNTAPSTITVFIKEIIIVIITVVIKDLTPRINGQVWI